MGSRSNSQPLRFHDMYVFLDKDGKPVDKNSSAKLLDERPGSTTIIRLGRRIKRSNGEIIPQDQQPLVAVKWTKEGVSTGKIVSSSLQLEAEIMREIGDHEHILKLEDFLIEEVESNTDPGEMAKQYWFIIQYAAGQDLLQWVRNAMMQWEIGKKESEVPRNVCVHLSLPVIRSIARQALSALAHMHSKHIWHRDCKPDNLFIRDEFPADLVDMVPFVLPSSLPSSSSSSSISLPSPSTNNMVTPTASNFLTTQSMSPNDDGNWESIRNGEGLQDFFSPLTEDNTPPPYTPTSTSMESRVDSGNGGIHVNSSIRYELWVRPSFARRRAGVNDSVIFTNDNKQTNPSSPSTSVPSSAVASNLASITGINESTSGSKSTPSNNVGRNNQAIVNAASKDPVPYILLSDFDAAKILHRPDTGVDRKSSPKDTQLSKAVGNVFFRAPEADTDKYDSAVDIWSLGITLLYGYCAGLELVRSTAERRIVGPDTQFLSDKVAGGEQIREHGLTDAIYDRINEMVIARGRSQGIDPLLGSLLRRMIVKDPKGRITAAEALNHEFFRSYTHLQRIRIPRSVNISFNLLNSPLGKEPRSPVQEGMSRSSSAGVSNSSTVTSDSAMQNSLFEETYTITLKPGEVLTTRKDAFCLVKNATRLPTATPHPYLRNGEMAIIKWYDLILMGETAHLDAEEVNERRLDRKGKPLKHDHLSTIYDVFSQYYPPLPSGKEPGDPGTENSHPSLIMVVEPAKGSSLDQFLLKQGERAVAEWSSPERDNWIDKANSRRMGSTYAGMNRSATNASVSSVSTPLISPELAHVVCGPYLAATIVKQILLTVQYLHSEGRAHRDIRMYALLLRDADITVQGTQCFPDAFSQYNLLVRVTLELDLEPSDGTNGNKPRISRRPLPYIKMPPVNPIRAGDSYDYTDFVLHKLPHQRTNAALDLWAIGDLLNVMLQGIQIKPRLASPLDMERRAHEIVGNAMDWEAQEMIDSLRNYDPSIHGSNTVDYITKLLQSPWFQRYGNVIDSRDYTPLAQSLRSNSTVNQGMTVPPNELPARTGSSSVDAATTKTVTTEQAPIVNQAPPPPPSAFRADSWMVIASLVGVIAYLLAERISK